jgi:hypothetical protein
LLIAPKNLHERRDVIDQLITAGLASHWQSLPKHKFEHKMMPTYDKLVQHGVTNTDDHAKKL